MQLQQKAMRCKVTSICWGTAKQILHKNVPCKVRNGRPTSLQDAPWGPSQHKSGPNEKP
eukprot:CAMPEP_0172888980 /NCGR_PEP_ID=MMETSP1075-20121228/137713_1 /TAXON_ID=2916 /ORGANISM="Ceratium fusus, Strain PA161109" /LENGTH=58 /DNA_ID=CAMNT_0013742941 /DNA_START=320 /DNA_END=496 /DNA_ORIENTATION=+